MNYTKLTQEHIGKEVIMFREPTSDEWLGVGRVSIDKILMKKCKITDFREKDPNDWIEVTGDSSCYSYPTCCFCLTSEYNTYEIY